jgi:hypothetical protein
MCQARLPKYFVPMTSQTLLLLICCYYRSRSFVYGVASARFDQRWITSALSRSYSIAPERLSVRGHASLPT